VRVFNFIFGATLFAAAMYLSYWHTYDMFMRGNYSGWSAHIGTYLGEGIFALGTINIFYAKIKGMSVSFISSPRMALYAGSLIVGYTNVSSGFGKGYEAIGIGVAIPILMLIAEAVITHSIGVEVAAKTQKIKKPLMLSQVIESIKIAPQKVLRALKSKNEKPQIVELQNTPQKNTSKKTSTQKVENNASGKVKINEGDDPLTIAAALKKELGRNPKIRELREKGISEWIARKTISQLKERAV
jgi:hypothetical protein